ncbi:hypothetical protein NESM_000712100 [Novymonas esmeraldas]|uniref:Uncharacterized protein n=1 Tax=Novymonas esmeraldas TaxID=1808958 RepID=A0AAW0EW17_9TRYP
MDVPFILLDTRTGFHLASRHLKRVGGPAKSKSALAVLCCSIYLQWSCVCERADGSERNGKSSEFIVESPWGNGATDDVQCFCREGVFLCVVFAKTRHTLYSRFAKCIAGEGACARSSDLKTAARLRECVVRVFKEAVDAAFGAAHVAEYAVAAWGPSGTVSAGSGAVGGRLSTFGRLTDASLLSGVFVEGDLKYKVDNGEGCLFVAVASNLSMQVFETLCGDEVLSQWAVSVCRICEV